MRVIVFPNDEDDVSCLAIRQPFLNNGVQYKFVEFGEANLTFIPERLQLFIICFSVVKFSNVNSNTMSRRMRSSRANANNVKLRRERFAESVRRLKRDRSNVSRLTSSEGVSAASFHPRISKFR